MQIRLLLVCLFLNLSNIEARATPAHPWLDRTAHGELLSQRVAPPPGFERLPAEAGSFAAWLRSLPLKPHGSPVLLHDGQHKWLQDAHVAVIDIDIGRRDLQQCADAVMRLRSEYLLFAGRLDEISFNDTGGGQPISFSKWAQGYRPRLSAQHLRWSRRGRRDASYASFRRYMDVVFAYAGTYSLSKQMTPVSTANMKIGDVFIQGGFPGHAVIVADMAVNQGKGERRFLLIQSYMPAQNMHILKNPRDRSGGPWYRLPIETDLQTPEWRFSNRDLKRW